VVSLGTGKEPSKTGKTGFQGILQTLIECATSTERVDEILAELLEPDIYFRFNPEHTSFEANLDETKKEKLVSMQEAAQSYIKDNELQFKKLAAVLNTDTN